MYYDRIEKGWYFSTNDRRLRYDDGRLIEPGITHKVDCKPVLCEQGLHASVRPLDALAYAPGPYVWRVEIGGEIISGYDKIAATERTYLWGFDATDTLRKFARMCALDVIHQWDAPEVVVRYLKTGDESLRVAARAAAWSAWHATKDSARGAAWEAAMAATKDSARVAARGAARGAAWAAWAAACHAARAAVMAAAKEKQNASLYRMLMGAATMTAVLKEAGDDE